MLKLRFMVNPVELQEQTYVEDPVQIKICDVDAMSKKGILGDSGMRMAKAGLTFYFERKLADELIAEGVAEKI